MSHRLPPPNMLNLLLLSVEDSTTMSPSHAASNHSSSSSSSSSRNLCNHSPSATLDLLILILVLFSGAFLLSSYLSYLFHSFSLLSSHIPLIFSDPITIHPASIFFAFIVFFTVSIVFLDLCFGPRSRKCHNPKCKGLKKAMEFDLQLQTEESVKLDAIKEIDCLPWKGGSQSNPDYECLRSELRRMAPPNGRAVLIFRSRCGCSVAKLEGWGPKRRRNHKKSQANLALKGG